MKQSKKSRLLANIVFELFFNPWSKVIATLLFFGILYWYLKPSENTISLEELKFQEITLTNEHESGSTRDNIKVYFTSKEFKNRFGITSGGTFENWKSINEGIEKSTKAKIAFKVIDEQNLNIPQKTIKIYHFETQEEGILFDLNNFKDREQRHDSRIIGFFSILFLLIFVTSLYKAIRYPNEHRENI